MPSQTWTPLPLHNTSLGHPHAPAPSMLYPASDIDWRFDSYMIVYMLECHSPKSSHPLPLPLSPKVRYIQAILIPACESSSLAFHMMYSAYMLNKQSDNIQPWCTPLPIFEPVCCSMSNSDCSFLTCIQVFPKIGKISLRIFHSSLWSTKSKTLV